MVDAIPKAAPSKPWYRSSTVIFAGAAAASVGLNGALESGAFVAFLNADWTTNIEMILQGFAFVFSGGAIRGRFMAKLPLK